MCDRRGTKSRFVCKNSFGAAGADSAHQQIAARSAWRRCAKKKRREKSKKTRGPMPEGRIGHSRAAADIEDSQSRKQPFRHTGNTRKAARKNAYYGNGCPLSSKSEYTKPIQETACAWRKKPYSTAPYFRHRSWQANIKSRTECPFGGKDNTLDRREIHLFLLHGAVQQA